MFPRPADLFGGASPDSAPAQGARFRGNRRPARVDRDTRQVVVGRSAELAALRESLVQALEGHAQVLALVGEAGLGKTTVLDALAASADGFEVVRLTGTPSESGLGYAGLAVLCREMSPHLDALPPRQRRAVDVCLAEGDTTATTQVDLLALGSALISIVAESAAEAPLLLVVDDLQWVDAESRRALAFATRRLSTERACVVLASRSDDVIPDSVRSRITLPRLSADEAEELLAGLGLDLDAPAALDVLTRARGNPLAVVELGRGRAAATTAGAPTDGAREAVGVDEVFVDQVAALAPPVREALLLAVCDGRVDLALVAAVLRSQGGGAAALDELVAAGLIVVSGSAASLRHPLLGPAVLTSAEPAAVRTAHAALADALEPYDDARALVHRALATVGPDEDLAARVSRSGDRAVAGGRPAEATRSLELATTLTLDREKRALWLVTAAEAAVASADSAAALDLAARCRALPAENAEALGRLDVLEGLIALRRGWRSDVGASIVTACTALDAARAAPVLYRICRVAMGEQDWALASAAADRLEAVDPGSAAFTAVVRMFARQDRWDPAASEDDVADLLAVFESPPPEADFATTAVIAGLAMEWGRIALARDLYLQAERAARLTGDVDDITLVAHGVAFCDHTLGRWSSSYARALEVGALLQDVDLVERRCEALLLVAEIDSARGQADRCRSTCAQVRSLAAALVDPVTALLADRREALLDLGLGRLDAAIARLESALTTARLQHIDRPYQSPVPDLVEAYVRAGRLDDARAVAPDFTDRVGPASPPLPRARALRIEGLLAEGSAYDELFAESVRLDLSVGLVFHAARTLLCHGERLRRDGRRVEARVRLHSALDIFQRLEAAPWAVRCESELAASGASVSAPRAEDVSAVLSPQELQVAVLVAEGRRNREIAETLFLSLRTVESHLSRIFRKLGVDSRHQLTLRMRDDAIAQTAD